MTFTERLTRTRQGAYLALVFLAPFAWQSAARALTVETWVEPEFTDCASTPRLIHPGTLNWSSDQLDTDTAEGTAEAADTPTDAIYGFIRTAVANTSSGGIVHTVFGGVYRDSTTVTISDSVTIHGFEGSDVILSGEACTSSASTAITINIASGETVILENLTFRGYTTAIDATGSTGGTIILRNCRIEDCTTGINGDDATLQVVDSRVSDCATGITGFVTLSLEDTEVSHNSTASVTGLGSANWSLNGCTITDNAAGVAVLSSGAGIGTVQISNCHILRNDEDGIHIDSVGFALSLHDSVVSDNAGDGVYLKATTAASAFSITDTLIQANEDDGVYVLNGDACAELGEDAIEGLVMNSRINANGDDGIEITGTGSTGCGDVGSGASAVECGLLGNSIAGNLDYGIVQATSRSAFHCQVGENLLSYNSTGAESGTGGVCTAASTSSNQAN